ncbi:uncharacterized protein LOC125050573 [Pieris napi]|uniref:uncharacterized protein LOC125050573 n=1 Tax=Pieris napi TaxID=78633 RepID=UPI001FBA757A|nr:uncharacterized protein LOC125050573 [Pieris napi]
MILFNIITLLVISCYGHEENSDYVLSRKKRFLIFPEGSSFQLVLCTTYPALTTIGDIFLWGNTAALAFELPQDPYSPFHHKADPQHRRIDSKHIYYVDENGKILYKQPYQRKLLVNPAFAKRSAIKVDRKKMHLSQTRPGFNDLDHNQIDFHRSSRTQLYEKLEVMMQGLGGNGRACLLKTMCMYRESAHGPQGGFLHEILRSVYTLPKSRSEDDFYQEYDEISSEKCNELYPECTFVASIK